ncbi:MAG TPA: nucleotidyltransferase [Terriglobales bacterium]|nr:nucleotidyltransferase [Terriglobales bacterium]
MRDSRVALRSAEKTSEPRTADATRPGSPGCFTLLNGLTKTALANTSATVACTNPSKRLMAEQPEKTPNASSPTSANPTPLAAEAAALYRDVLLTMNERGIPYAVAGAFALQKYTGIWRVTKDLDLFVKSGDVPAALDYLCQQGFLCETLDPVWLSKARRGEYFVDLISGMSNAVIMVDDSWMKRTHPAVIAGVKSQIISAEDLIASKLFVTRRERFDGADIAHIIYRTKGQLEWERILELAGEHWEMILWGLVLFRYVYPAHTDYVPAPLWQDLLSRYMHLVQHPDPSAPFRGSLIDENIFSIDVKDWSLEDVQSEYRKRHLQKLPGRAPSLGVIRKSGTS